MAIYLQSSDMLLLLNFRNPSNKFLNDNWLHPSVYHNDDDHYNYIQDPTSINGVGYVKFSPTEYKIGSESYIISDYTKEGLSQTGPWSIELIFRVVSLNVAKYPKSKISVRFYTNWLTYAISFLSSGKMNYFRFSKDNTITDDGVTSKNISWSLSTWYLLQISKSYNSNFTVKVNNKEVLNVSQSVFSKTKTRKGIYSDPDHFKDHIFFTVTIFRPNKQSEDAPQDFKDNVFLEYAYLRIKNSEISTWYTSPNDIYTNKLDKVVYNTSEYYSSGLSDATRIVADPEIFCALFDFN